MTRRPSAAPWLGAGLLLSLASGCASTSAEGPTREVSALTAARTGAPVAFLDDDESRKAADREVDRLLASPLGPEEAVRVALVKSPHLRMEYAELGVSQAELVQAGLLKNPSLSGAYRFPLDPGHGAGIEADAAVDVLGLLTLPSRRSIAGAQVEATVYRVGAAVVRHAFDVRIAWYGLVAAEQGLAVQRAIADAAGAAREIAERQAEAGNLNDLNLGNERALAAQVALDTRRAEAEVIAARERLNRLMGLSGRYTRWKTPTRLPDLPPGEPAARDLEALAARRRLDVAAARRDVEVVAKGLSLVKATRWVPGLAGGVSYEKKPEGIRLFGPSVSLDVPLFDQGQAQVARLEALERKARARVDESLVDGLADVREHSARLGVQRALVESYTKTLVPLREDIVNRSQEQYDAMLLGVFQLLQAKQAEFAAYRELVDALRDYWITRTELEAATGGRLAGSLPTKEAPR